MSYCILWIELLYHYYASTSSYSNITMNKWRDIKLLRVLTIRNNLGLGCFSWEDILSGVRMFSLMRGVRMF